MTLNIEHRTSNIEMGIESSWVAAGGRAGLTVRWGGDSIGDMADLESESLGKLRGEIDALDARIVEMLNARARVVVEIGKVKQQNNSPIYAPDREKAVMEKVRGL